MNAYRNYTNNVSAMKSNLEKLSSGYKINRAGDDAAGLAISEKMRAQITGLETAQKNAKDGISLVQTAEGALTEVHDMLNRMVELATQSANGTYDDTVDRAQMQKEIVQLRSEIDRIADSSNFNGIKLLDGSMDAEGFIHGTGTSANDGSPVYFQPNSGTAANVPKIAALAATGATPTLGVNTILHADAATGSKGTEFSVDFHDLKLDGKVGDKLTITLGDASGTEGTTKTTIELTVASAATSKGYTADDIVKALAGTTTGDFTVKVGGDAFTPGASAEMTIMGGKFKLTAGTNGRLNFAQSGIPATQSEEVKGGMAVTVTSTPKVPKATGMAAASKGTTQAGTSSKAGTYTLTLKGLTALDKGEYEVTVAGQKVTVNIASDATSATAAHTALATALKDQLANKFKDGISSTSVYTVAASSGVLTFTASGNGSAADGANITNTITIAATDKRTVAHKGDYNVQTTDVKNVAFGGGQRLASTTFTLTRDMVTKDGTLTIGSQDLEFTTDSAQKNSEGGKVYIGDMVDDKGNLKSNADLNEIARRISNSAKDNTIWTVGVAGATGSKITLVEKTDGTGAATGNAAAKTKFGKDLTTAEGIAATLGYKGAVKPEDPGERGKSLTLQIGDTAQDFNQLKVNIKDMHTEAMKYTAPADAEGYEQAATGTTIAQIDISSQTGAAKAVAVIKAAINYVSDVRGDLGATQNRLDHTINNLSVMTENIQDAESTIRDVDVAEEMMAYTKNNILIQSAQAMLAQANQVPQGVLQLLQ